MAAQAYNPSPQEAAAERPQVPGLPGLVVFSCVSYLLADLFSSCVRFLPSPEVFYQGREAGSREGEILQLPTMSPPQAEFANFEELSK